MQRNQNINFSISTAENDIKHFLLTCDKVNKFWKYWFKWWKNISKLYI